MDERERRIGVNEGMFREVNERLEALNETFSTFTDAMQVVCECGEATCTEQFAIPPDEYQQIRRDPLLFVMVPGHEKPDVEVVAHRDERYQVVKKLEERGVDTLAEVTHPRA